MATVKEIQKEKTINQILYLALNEFIGKGFHGASTREIAKAAGISSGLMFHYFQSKDCLYGSLIAIGCEKLHFDIGEAGKNPLAYLREVVKNILQELEGNDFFAKMFILIDNAQHTRDIPLQAKELLASHDLIRQLIPIVEKGQALGQFRPGNPHALVVAFGGAIQGIAQESVRSPGTPMPDAEWVLDMIRNSEDKPE